MPNPVLRSLRSLSNASPEARKVFFRCARHLTVNRQIYPQLAAPISVKTPPIPAAKLASTEFDGKFDGGFCGTYGACSTEVRLALCGWTPRRYSTSPVSRAAPYTPLDAAFQLHGRVCGYALAPRLARAVFHPSVGCVPSRLRWTRWTLALNAGGQGDIRKLILPRRAGQAPRCTIGSWAPLTVWGRSTFAAPPMPTGETLGRLPLAAACSGLRPCPKGFALWTPTLAAVRLGAWVMRSLRSLLLHTQSQRLGRSSQHQAPFAAYPRLSEAPVFHGGLDPALR